MKFLGLQEKTVKFDFQNIKGFSKIALGKKV